MITIKITEEVAAILHRILEDNVEDLRTEIHHTDNRDYREMLLKQEELIKQLLLDIELAGVKKEIA